MVFKTLGLTALLTFIPLQTKAQDTTKINLNFPKLELKIQEFPTSLSQSKIQYNFLILRKPNMTLFTEYQSPKDFYKPKIKTKEISYLSTGIKINF